MASAWDASARSRFLIAADCAAGTSEWLAQPTTISKRLVREIPEPRTYRPRLPLRLSAMSSSWRIAIPPLPVPRAPLGFPSLSLHDTLLGGPKSGYPQPGPIESHVGPHYGSLLPSVSSERHINGWPPPQNSCSVPLVYLTVRLNQCNNAFHSPLQDNNMAAFRGQLFRVTWLTTIFIFLAVYQVYLNQMLEIRWRRWLTDRYLRPWLTDGAYYRMQLQETETDNPDQRIAEDVQLLAAHTLGLFTGGLRAIVTLVT